MNNKRNPLDRLKHHVTGAIERGEAKAITAVTQSHTPGPWSFGGSLMLNSINYLYVTAEAAEGDIAMLPGKNTEERIANARLIAASPVLLDVVEALAVLNVSDVKEGELRALIIRAALALKSAKAGA